MSFSRVLNVLRKDLRLGPRSPLFLYAIVFPVAATLIIQVVFGGLFEPAPRLGIVDLGDSAIAEAAESLEGVDVTMVRTVSRLKDDVENNDLDAGLVLPSGFDADLTGGANPPLEFYVGGESLASNRVILGTTLVGLVRDMVGEPAPIEVVIEATGDQDALPLSDRLIPLLVLFAVLIAGLFVPAASLVEEKEKGTLSAVLITPAKIGEVFTAKGVMGFALAIATGVVTLVLNQAFGSQPALLLFILAVAALMALEIGLIVGANARNTNTLFSVIKGGNIILLAPVIFFIWPDLPTWIPKLFPTYYFLNPLFEVAVRDARLDDVWRNLVVALAICAALLPVVAWSARRMASRLAEA